jgi:hypothetical protein
MAWPGLGAPRRGMLAPPLPARGPSALAFASTHPVLPSAPVLALPGALACLGARPWPRPPPGAAPPAPARALAPASFPAPARPHRGAAQPLPGGLARPRVASRRGFAPAPARSRPPPRAARPGAIAPVPWRGAARRARPPPGARNSPRRGCPRRTRSVATRGSPQCGLPAARGAALPGVWPPCARPLPAQQPRGTAWHAYPCLRHARLGVVPCALFRRAAPCLGVAWPLRSTARPRLAWLWCLCVVWPPARDFARRGA